MESHQSWRQVEEFQLDYAPAALAYTNRMLYHPEELIKECITVCDDGWPGKYNVYSYHIHNGLQTSSGNKPGMADIWDMAYAPELDVLLFTEGNSNSGRFHANKCWNIDYPRQMSNNFLVGYSGPGGIAKYGEDIFVTSANENKVYKVKFNVSVRGFTSFSTCQTFVRESMWQKTTGETNGLSKPSFIAANGNRVAVGSFSNRRVSVYDYTAKLLFVIGEQKTISPFGLALSKDDWLFICDSQRKCVHIVSPYGKFTKEIKTVACPRRVVVRDDGSVVVAGSSCKDGVPGGVVTTYKYC